MSKLTTQLQQLRTTTRIEKEFKMRMTKKVS